MEVDFGVDDKGKPTDPEFAAAVEQDDKDAEFDIAGLLSDEPRTESFTPDEGDEYEETGEPEPAPKRERVKSKQFGGEIPPEMRDLFSAQGFGEIMTQGTNGFYQFCDAPVLDDVEAKLSRQAWAYWAQCRIPEDFTIFQPELILLAALAMPLVRHNRMEKVGPKIRPGLSRIWSWVTSPVRWLFKKKEAAQPATNGQ